MGSGIAKEAMSTPKEVQDIIRADDGLEDALTDQDIEPVKVRRAVRVLVDSLCRSVADRAVAKAGDQYIKEVIGPVSHKGAQIQVLTKNIMVLSADLSKAVLRISGGSVNEAEAKLIRDKYDQDIVVVERAVTRQSSYLARISAISFKIDVILAVEEEDSDLSELATLQDQRSALEKENTYVGKNMIKHFEVGSSGTLEKLNILVIPEQLQQGKGKELIRNVKAFLDNRTPLFYAIMPDLQYCMANSLIGLNQSGYA
jgi:hypothetical protein